MSNALQERVGCTLQHKFYINLFVDEQVSVVCDIYMLPINN